MSRLALNKGEMHRRRRELETYQRVLPSLDLKRRQLAAEILALRYRLEEQRSALDGLHVSVGEALPMLANEDIEVAGLVRIEAVDIAEEQLLGARLPKIAGISFAVRSYSLLVKPHWVDRLVVLLREALRQELELQVTTERLRRLEYAMKRTVQRINLFDKVLIPGARGDIQRIRIFLADAERAAIVRSKIAKARHERQRERSAEEDA